MPHGSCRQLIDQLDRRALACARRYSYRAHVPLALLGSALLMLSARLQISFYRVPMTLQILVVLLVGLAFALTLCDATMVRRRFGA